jgi:dolichol-phosphate mannosyltransferase
MPCYNEQAAIEKVIRMWFATLGSSVQDFTLFAINDGSADNTESILNSLASELGPRLEIISRANRGHGQTCLEGYRIAIKRNIPYILQIDSDGQSDPMHFADFWSRREEYDVIYGKRIRHDGTRRVFASAVLRNLLRLLAKADCIDANVPYRLMNTAACADDISSIPANFFLANVALAVRLKRNHRISHGHTPITFPPRLGGEPSVPFSKFAEKAFELFQQLKGLEQQKTSD